MMIYSIVLLSALSHAAWNSLIKSSFDKLVSMCYIRTVGLIIGLIAIFFVGPPSLYLLPYIFIGASFHFLYYFFLIRAYEKGSYINVYPIARGLAPLFVLIASVLVLDAKLKNATIAGVIVVSLSVLFLVRNNRNRKSNFLTNSIMTAISIAGYTIVSSEAVNSPDGFLVYFAWLEVLTGAGVLAITLIKRGRNIAPTAIVQIRTGLISAFLSIFAYGASLWAMTHVSVSAVSALRETSVVFATIFSIYLNKEKPSVRTIMSVFIIFIGICLIIV